jgi:hypothetical protein
MLKKFLASMVLTIGTIHPSLANEVTQFPTNLSCIVEKDLEQTIAEFGELIFAGGVSMREIPGVGLVQNNLVIFVNPKTRSWTMVERFTKDMYCVVALGQGFRPLGSQ